MRLTALLVAGSLSAFLVVGACGGSTATIPGGAGGGGGGGAGGAGGAGGDGSAGDGPGGAADTGTTTDSGGGDASGATCQDMYNQIMQLRPAAQKCCPACNHAPCTFAVDDVCCPLTVDTQGTSNVTDFENAVKAFRLAKCLFNCPALPCPPSPSGICDPATSECR